jgi:superfamily I DNA/RNA helicase
MVCVDEAQDLDPCQQVMLDRMVTDTALIVGDKYQAIYGFRGADANSWDRLMERHSCIQLPLTWSFRCPRAVVREAQQWVPEILPTDSAPEGEVKDLGRGAWREMIKYGDVILCRNNKPLIPVFYQLLRRGIGAKIAGADIGKGLIALVKKIPGGSLKEFLSNLEIWAEAERAKARAKGKESKVGLIDDKVGCLILIAEATGSRDGLIKQIESMFSNERAPVTLSTVHKAKGLEWDRVFFLDRDLIPSPYCKLPWEQQQERNILYVAVTRAKHSLFYVRS